jgi:hypothetical protein
VQNKKVEYGSKRGAIYNNARFMSSLEYILKLRARQDSNEKELKEFP